VKVAISANPAKSVALAAARRAFERLEGKAEVEWSEETARALGVTDPGRPVEEFTAEALVGFGGDGTFLTLLKRTAIPLLPVNAGTVGFLAEIDADKPAALDDALVRLVEHRYFVEDRMKLACTVAGAALPDATNEVVVHTSQVAKMRVFEIAIDGEAVGQLRADGLILSTPTGSTSYSLSALGPVIEPTVEAIVVTALAPFQATQRAVVIDPLRTVSVRLVHPEKDGVVVIDGQSETKIAAGESVTVYRSSRPASFVRFGAQFYRRLLGRGILPWAAGGAEPFGADPDVSPST